LEYMAAEAPRFGADVVFLTPERFRSFPMPTYPEIRLSLVGPAAVARVLDEVRPTHVHIATEGPIGLATRLMCGRQGRAFTTSYHTRFPEYVAARMAIPEAWSYKALLRFHQAARAMMVSTPSLEQELAERGFRNIMRWTRGVDTTLFRPRSERVLDLPGTKVIVGDGPSRQDLERKYPEGRFLGALAGEDLARVYASADVFVFPSLTDTFGIVLIEALASGLPIAAFPVTGPVDVVGCSGCGALNHDLRHAALEALRIPRDRCRAYGETFTWQESARQFYSNIVIAHSDRT
jgi:glycosyltransferase involved in cell wall biosynthesis